MNLGKKLEKMRVSSDRFLRSGSVGVSLKKMKKLFVRKWEDEDVMM